MLHFTLDIYIEEDDELSRKALTAVLPKIIQSEIAKSPFHFAQECPAGLDTIHIPKDGIKISHRLCENNDY